MPALATTQPWARLTVGLPMLDMKMQPLPSLRAVTRSGESGPAKGWAGQAKGVAPSHPNARRFNWSLSAASAALGRRRPPLPFRMARPTHCESLPHRGVLRLYLFGCGARDRGVRGVSPELLRFKGGAAAWRCKVHHQLRVPFVRTRKPTQAYYACRSPIGT